MKLYRVISLTLMVLGLAGSLFGDPTDPGILFNQGGHHSTDILPSCAVHPSCFVEINDPIVAGGGNFDIHNESGKNINKLIFFIPTLNFDQVFFAESNLFLDAFILPDFVHNETDVAFFGLGNGPDAFATIPPPLDTCEFCAPGFVDGSNANPPESDPNFNFRVEVFFGNPPKGANHPGLKNGDEGVLGLIAVPEPGTFAMLIGALGVAFGTRKLQSRKHKA